MTHHEDFLATSGGLKLFHQAWLPAVGPRAAVAIVHGFTEHGGRYAATAEHLCSRGYAVHAVDLRGHGRSEGSRCFVRSFDEYLDDLDLLVESIRRQNADAPLFLFGHSMGGLAAALWCITRQPAVGGLILSAPALRVKEDLFPILRRLAGPVGRVFPRWRLVRMGTRNISRDPAATAQFEADPLVFHGRFPVRTGAEILRAMRWAGSRYEAIRPPLCILQGTADRVSDPAACRELCRRGGSGDKTLRLYEGFYHEVLSDPQRDLVVADLIAWLDQRCS